MVKSMQKLIDVIEVLAYECDYDLDQYDVEELKQIKWDLDTVNRKLTNLKYMIIKKEGE